MPISSYVASYRDARIAIILNVVCFDHSLSCQCCCQVRTTTVSCMQRQVSLSLTLHCGQVFGSNPAQCPKYVINIIPHYLLTYQHHVLVQPLAKVSKSSYGYFAD